MRRQICVLLLLMALFGAPLFAQTEADHSSRPTWLVGGEAGITVGGSVGALFDQDEFVQRWPVVGYAFSFAAEYSAIPSWLWIESGFGIMRTGHGYRFVGGATNADYHETITYLMVPITAKTVFRAGLGDVTIGLGAAVAVALFTGGTITDHTTSLTSRLADTYYDNYLLPVNGMLLTTAAYEYPTPFGRLGIELVIDIHLFSDFEWGIPSDGNRLVTARLQALYRFAFE